MGERPNTIAALLNSGGGTATSSATAAPVGDSTSPGTSAPTDTSTPPDTSGPVSYDVPPGHSASDAQLSLDASPDALISVDGHQVAAGDDGLSLDIAPDGSTHVTYAPIDGTRPHSAQPVRNGDPSGGQQHQDGRPGQDSSANDLQPGQPTQDGLPSPNGDHSGGQQHPDAQPGQDGPANDLQPGQPTQDGGPSVTDPSGTHTGTGGQDDVPIEHLKGHGDDAAQVDLALHAPGHGADATVVTHQRNDGGYDLTVPKGHGNPHAFTVHVKPNPDGSLDITVPKGHGNAHEIKIHVQPGKHVDLNITRDKDGHTKIDAHEHKPDQTDDWPGLKQPAGQGTPGLTAPSGNAGAPSTDPGGAPSTGGLPGLPRPSTPTLPSPADAGGGPSSGGGGLPGGGGGLPSGGVPSGGSPYDRAQPPPQTPRTPQTPDIGSPYKSITPDSLKRLAKTLEHGAGTALGEAYSQAAGIQIGWPGTGVAGIPIRYAHGKAVETAANQLDTGHKTLKSWVPALNRNADNWTNTETQNINRVNSTDPTG